MSNRRFNANSFTRTLGLTPLPFVPNLKALAFFGTGGDGINGNRVPGGSAFSTTGTPTYLSNYVTVGNSNLVNLGFSLDSSMNASGWTFMFVARVPPSGGRSALISNASYRMIADPGNLYSSRGGGTLSSVTNTLATVTPMTSWHTVAETKAPGGSGSVSVDFTLYDLKDNPTPAVVHVISPVGGSGFYLGGSSANDLAFINTADIAFAMVSASPMTADALTAFTAALVGTMAYRGVILAPDFSSDFSTDFAR